ncbi:hypothetical protein RSAG8_13585, partial [Rhizoctonia solani AG-8 WAC10335]
MTRAAISRSGWRGVMKEGQMRVRVETEMLLNENVNFSKLLQTRSLAGT